MARFRNHTWAIHLDMQCQEISESGTEQVLCKLAGRPEERRVCYTRADNDTGASHGNTAKIVENEEDRGKTAGVYIYSRIKSREQGGYQHDGIGERDAAWEKRKQTARAEQESLAKRHGIKDRRARKGCQREKRDIQD
jgi:hypothetical protein